MKGFIPSGPEIVREAIIVIVGAALAAFVVRNIPGLRAYIKDNLS